MTKYISKTFWSKEKRFEYAAFRSQLGQVFWSCWFFFSFFLVFFFRLVFCSFFGRFWEASWELFGCQNRSKTGQVGLKTALGTIFFEKSEFSRVCACVCGCLRFGAFFGNFVALFVPKRCQDDLEEVFFSIRFLHRFLVVCWSDFGVILGGFWEAFGVQIGIFLGFFALIFLIMLHAHEP